MTKLRTLRDGFGAAEPDWMMQRRVAPATRAVLVNAMLFCLGVKWRVVYAIVFDLTQAERLRYTERSIKTTL